MSLNYKIKTNVFDCKTGKTDLTETDISYEEIKAFQYEQEKAERDYWLNMDYSELVNTEVRKRYTESQEFAILRQREDKSEEYNAYYEYCEACKLYVKEQIAKYS